MSIFLGEANELTCVYMYCVCMHVSFCSTADCFGQVTLEKENVNLSGTNLVK